MPRRPGADQGADQPMAQAMRQVGTDGGDDASPQAPPRQGWYRLVAPVGVQDQHARRSATTTTLRNSPGGRPGSTTWPATLRPPMYCSITATAYAQTNAQQLATLLGKDAQHQTDAHVGE
jgi:hypothetical protein